MASAAILVGFLKFQILNGRIGQECQTASLRQISRFELRYGAKLHRNRSTRYRYLAIFWFFKIAAAVMLNIRNFKLYGRNVRKSQLHHDATFRTMARDSIFRCFNMVSAAILNFWNAKSLTVKAVKRMGLRHRAEFCRKCSNRGEICRFFDFLKWQPPP